MVEVIDAPKTEDIYTHQLRGMHNARVQVNGVIGDIRSRGVPSPYLMPEILPGDEGDPAINIIPGDEILVPHRCGKGNVILHRYVFMGDYRTPCMNNRLPRQTTK